jgi:hypothetical protein
MLQEGVSYRYDYPLGTGQAWEQPIPLTQIYVTAPEELFLEVRFPGRERRKESIGKGMPGLDLAESLAYAADGQQVHMASYEMSNEKQDVEIRLDENRKSEFKLAQEKSKRRIILGWIGFPLVGLLGWLTMFRLIVWPNEYARRAGFIRAFLWHWLAGVVLLAIVIPIGLSALYVVDKIFYWYDRPFDDLAMISPPIVTILLTLLAIILLPLLFVKRGIPELPSFLRKSALAVILAGIIYFIIGATILSEGSPLSLLERLFLF